MLSSPGLRVKIILVCWTGGMSAEAQTQRGSYYEFVSNSDYPLGSTQDDRRGLALAKNDDAQPYSISMPGLI